MPVRMDWDNPERTVIRVTFEGQWSTDDIHRMITKGSSMVESVDHTVDTIYDFTYSKCLPNNLLSCLGRMENTYSKKQRFLIIVKANSYIETLCLISQKLAPKTFGKLVLAKNLAGAYDHISKF